MVDSVRWRILLVGLATWVNRHQLGVIAYLREDNRVLKEQLESRGVRLTDVQRRPSRGRGTSGARCRRAALKRTITAREPDTGCAARSRA
jgi:hypothetical protein